MHPVLTRRKALGMTQKELAELVNLDFTIISKIECKRRALKVTELQRFARALHCREQDLLPSQDETDGHAQTCWGGEFAQAYTLREEKVSA